MELSLQALSATDRSLPSECASDDDLVARAAHDRSAFAELYQRHYRAIGSYLFRRTGDHHATEELLSDVFFAALRGLRRYRARGLSLRAWLYRIATNEANRWARRRRRRRRLYSLEDVVVEVPDRGDASPTATGGFARLHSALWSLPVRHQAVVALFYLEELSVEEIAQVLATRVGTVKSRLARARETLREKLRGRA
ncbi:MAG: RNA polymerase sigma factor [Planctomycetota bacterium]